MKKLAYVALVAALPFSASGQATKDRNLAATRKHGATSTVLPGQTNGGGNGQKDANSQLDKLEHQTANTVIQPAAKSPKVQPYKLPPEPKPAADNFYQQSMPAKTGLKNTSGSGSSNRSPRSSRVNPYKR